MSRYASLLKQQGAGKVMLACPESLQRLMRSFADIDEVHCRSPLPDFEVGVFLLSLPRLLGTTSVERIPARASYLDWRARNWSSSSESRLAAAGRSTRWISCGNRLKSQGNTEHAADLWRSVDLGQFVPLAELAGVRLISLQKGDGRDQLEKYPDLAVDLGPRN